MTKKLLTPELSDRLANLYHRMETAYNRVAGELAFSCTGCPDNCCDSFFQHHTILEWAYLWQGLAVLEAARLSQIRQQAELYLAEATAAIARQERPQLICPVNDQGRCLLYAHRLMICRLHGVPSTVTRPNGEKQSFPGCFRCQELTAGRPGVVVERGELYRELAELERELLTTTQRRGPRIKMTIAEMILAGPPQP